MDTEDITKWVNQLTKHQIDTILIREYKRRETKRKYITSDKGKLTQSEACKRYYVKSKSMKDESL